MKTNLSLNPKIITYILALVSVLILLKLLIEVIQDKFQFGLFIIACLFILTTIFCYSFKKLVYDNKFLYILDNAKEIKIDLRNVKTIKPTMTKIAGWTVWKIKYYNSNNKIKSIRFLPYGFKNKVFDFSETVKKHNTNLNFTTWTSNFDFDQ
ncbi:hypothetical protein NO995_10135 [Aestuariibaculum sp. M13]|uniref:hypothetical protein n=1 Tax=Aestuariibaculum sp. M13 TaxID=2967132 RepID=UPI002159DEBB|nr:hypothetical protein [Aestuariibaculum sp. M13]MCR8668041.1 hypothetical protein [Aestuariibaculum sp. M13]